MIIEIRKAGFINKGAELMLHAVVEQLRKRYPDAKLTMAPMYGGAEDTFEKMRQLNLYPKIQLWRYGFELGGIAKFIPENWLRLYGLIHDQQVDVVIDAAGFSYSDQWGVNTSKQLAISSNKWKKNGTTVILLPQALGPYQQPKIQSFVREWIANVDLVFAREPDSYKYLTDLVGDQSKIKLSPDFTNLIKGTLPKGYDATDKRIALVPNYRMIDKTNKQESEAYLPFMIRCANYLVAQGAKPFVLVHEGANDQMLANKISEAVGGMPIVKVTDPLHIKGILGTCDATIGSRFHGLVSSLSQGVPSLATGWSHKYLRLFEDYGFKEGIVTVLDSDEDIHYKIDLLLNPEFANPLRQKLSNKSEELKILSEKMWEKVFQTIDNSANKK